MKKIMPLMLLMAALSLIPSHSYSSSLGTIRLSFIEGDVQIYTEDTSEWVAATINMPLRDGDRIWVPQKGRAELQLNDGSSLRLNEDSSLEILRTEIHSFQFYLSTGYAYVNFRGSRESLFQLDTPISSARAYEKGIFRVDVTDDTYTDISVIRGLVHVDSERGSKKVKEGYTLSISEDDYADLHTMEHPDEWVTWNEERDEVLYEKRYSTRYLPDELSPYSSDFDSYGSWVYIEEYGHVWTPSAVVSVGWAPYRHGRWVWIADDYIWISYEPWGWVPYHYGRWIFNVSIGWCWVPPVRDTIYWGPGFVGWVYTPEYVAWVPLAPGEIYYGYGYYGPHSVNITNINITNIKVKKAYKNVRFNNAVTTIHRDTFIKGKNVRMREKENPFLKEKISIGRPAIKPERETTRPYIREISNVKQPPFKIKKKKIEDLRKEQPKEQPLVNRKTRSVMRPDSLLRGMPLKIEKSEASKDRRIESASVERKEPKVPVEREKEKPVKQETRAVRRMDPPEYKTTPERKMERPIVEKPNKQKELGERKIEKQSERHLIMKREKMQQPIEKQEKIERKVVRSKGPSPLVESQLRIPDTRNKKTESRYQFNNSSRNHNDFKLTNTN